MKHLSVWIDMRANAGCPEVLNHPEMSSICSVSNTLRYLMKKNDMKDFLPSILYTYYFIKKHNHKDEKHIKYKDIFKAIKNHGIVSEKDYPYIEDNKDKEPNIKGKEFNFSYELIEENVHKIKEILSTGLPIIFKFDIFEHFYSDEVKETGVVKIPKRHERPLEQSISAIIVGYRTSSESFICMSNFGVDFGERGFFYLPYEYVSKYAYNFYILKI